VYEQASIQHPSPLPPLSSPPLTPLPPTFPTSPNALLLAPCACGGVFPQARDTGSAGGYQTSMRGFGTQTRADRVKVSECVYEQKWISNPLGPHALTLCKVLRLLRCSTCTTCRHTSEEQGTFSHQAEAYSKSRTEAVHTHTWVCNSRPSCTCASSKVHTLLRHICVICRLVSQQQDVFSPQVEDHSRLGTYFLLIVIVSVTTAYYRISLDNSPSL